MSLCNELLAVVRDKIESGLREIDKLRTIEVYIQSGQLPLPPKVMDVLVTEPVVAALPAPVGEAGAAVPGDRLGDGDGDDDGERSEEAGPVGADGHREGCNGEVAGDELRAGKSAAAIAAAPPEESATPRAASGMLARRLQLASKLEGGASLTVDEAARELGCSKVTVYNTVRCDDFYLQDGRIGLSALGLANQKRRRGKENFNGYKRDERVRGVDVDTPAAVKRDRQRIAKLIDSADGNTVSMLEIMGKLKLGKDAFAVAIDCDWFMEPRRGHYNLTIVGRTAAG